MINISMHYHLLTFILLFAFCFADGQNNPVKMNCDSAFYISKSDFDSSIIRSTILLSSEELQQISDNQHREIIRVYNTISMSQNANAQFSTGFYNEFMRAFNTKSYVSDIIKVYPNWIPNRGMGYFLQELQIELGGTPCLWSRYVLN